MEPNVKIAIVTGIVTIIGSAISTFGVIYSKTESLDAARSQANTAAQQAAVFQIPRGAVMAFDLADCPAEQGWADYEESAGRTIIGVGKGENLSTRTLKEMAGEEQVEIEKAHLPPHEHSYIDWHYFEPASPSDNYATGNGDDTGNMKKREGTTIASDIEPALLNNMPPFIALRYCKKT